MSTNIKWYDDNKNRISTTVATPSDIPNIPSVPTVNKSDLRNFVGFFDDLSTRFRVFGNFLSVIAQNTSDASVSVLYTQQGQYWIQTAALVENYKTDFENAFGL